MDEHMTENENLNSQENAPAKKKKLWIPITLLLVGVAVLTTLLLWPKVMRNNKEFHMELGESLTTDINDYVKGNEKLIAAAHLDITQVNQTKAGEYQARVTYHTFLFQQEKIYTYPVSIVDTIAPTVEVVQAPYYVGQSQHYAPSDFVTKCEDASNDVTLYLVGDSSNIIASDTLGSYTFEIGAVDPSGNETITPVTVEVDTVPQFINAKSEKWFTTDTYKYAVTDVVAYDEAEGLLENSMVVENAEALDGSVGDVTLHYAATDSHGIVGTTDVTVHVVGSESEIPDSYDQSLSTEDLTILCNYDYFSYQTLEEDDYALMLATVEPCLFDMWKGLTQEQINAGWTGKYSGSGFILDITPEYIYAITDEHCYKNMHENTNFIFFNHYQLSGCSYEDITSYQVDGYGGDASLFRMDVSAIPSYTLLLLKKAAVSQAAYDSMQAGQTIVAYAKYWKAGDDRITKHKVTNTNGYYEKWPGKILITSSGLAAGMSGTGAFDLKGNLVGVAYATYSNENWFAPVDAVLYLSERRNELDGKKVAGAE